MTYPRILQDEESEQYFIAESTGPRSWRYHRTWFGAWFELVACHLAAVAALMFTAAIVFGLI